MTPRRADPRADAEAASGRLNAWLLEAAFPTWAERGFDPVSGRFHERIGMDGAPVHQPSRGRVAPRQLYAFAAAARLGWSGDVAGIVRTGLATYLRDHRRPDGLFRPVGAADGPLSDPVELYDQAFALFGLAAAHPHFEGGLAPVAAAVREGVRLRLGQPGGGFRPAWPPRAPLESNPQMHLLEGCLAWTGLSDDPAWRGMAAEIVELARRRLIDPASGVLREFFADDWTPAAGVPGRIVEPGHQFEWAWLLLLWSGETGDAALRAAALRLIEIGETRGVDEGRGLALDALLDDLSVHARTTRLWPQTERIKAAALAAKVTGDPAYWSIAARAVAGLERFLRDAPWPGLWRERQDAEDRFIEEPAPATSLYHIVLAAEVLTKAVAPNPERGAL